MATSCSSGVITIFRGSLKSSLKCAAATLILLPMEGALLHDRVGVFVSSRLWGSSPYQFWHNPLQRLDGGLGAVPKCSVEAKKRKC